MHNVGICNSYIDFCHQLTMVNENTPVHDLSEFFKQNYQWVVEAAISDWKVTRHISGNLARSALESVLEFGKISQRRIIAEKFDFSIRQLFATVENVNKRTAILYIAQSLKKTDKLVEIINFINNEASDEAIDRILKADEDNRIKTLSEEMFRKSVHYRYSIPRNFDKMIFWRHQAAHLDNIDAICCIGNWHYHGDFNHKESIEETCSWYKKAIGDDRFSDETDLAKRLFKYTQSLANASYMAKSMLGHMYLNGIGTEVDSSKAFICFNEVALDGNIIGMENIAYSFIYGEGTTIDAKQALVWINKALALGSDQAMVYMGHMHWNGMAFECDKAKAVEWYLKSIDLGNDDCFYDLGFAYERGEGVEKDIQKAIEFYEKGAKDTKCVSSLIRIYEKVQKDPEKALHWMEVKANRGDQSLYTQISQTYFEGDTNIPVNHEKALEWALKGAEAGIATCMHNAGYFYMKKDEYEEGFKWTEKAINAGEKECLHNLAYFYLNGKVVAKDIDKAISLYETCASLKLSSSAESMLQLGNIYKNGIPDNAKYKDREKSLFWFKQGAELKHIPSLLSLAEMSFAENPEESKQWYEKAANLGNTKAMFLLTQRFWKKGERNDFGCHWAMKAVKADHEELKKLKPIFAHIPKDYRIEGARYLIRLYFDEKLSMHRICDVFSLITPPRKNEREFFNNLIQWIDKDWPQKIVIAKIVNCYRNNNEVLSLENDGLTSLPDAIGYLKNLKTLYLEKNQLKTLPESFKDLQNLTTLRLKNNKFTTLPDCIFELPGFHEYISIFEDNPLCNSSILELKITDIRSNPLKVLRKFIAFLQLQRVPDLNVKFTDQNQNTADQGGPSRQFLHDLFESLTKTNYFVPDDDYFQPFSKNPSGTLSNEDLNVYKNIGIAMMFAYWKSFPIGILFKDEMFDALLKFGNMNTPQLSDEFMLSQNSAQHQEMLMRMAFDPEYAKVICTEFGIEIPKTLTIKELDEIKMKFSSSCLEMVKPKLEPLYAMAQGMKSAKFFSFLMIGQKTAADFAVRMQGKMSKDILLQALAFNSTIDQEKQKWLKDWIEEASKEDLKLFVKCATGSSALPESTTIAIEKTEMDLIFRTCGRQVDIPFDVFENKQSFYKELNKTIKFLEYTFNAR